METTQETQFSSNDLLPQEILREIFLHLFPSSIFSALQTCKSWHRIQNDPTFWNYWGKRFWNIDLPKSQVIDILRKQCGIDSLPFNYSPWKKNVKIRELPLKVVSTDGGAWSDSYNVQNSLCYGGRCYCTAVGKNANVNVVFCHQTERPLWISSLMVVAPSYGYTAPIESGLVFLADDLSIVESSQKFNNFTETQWNELNNIYKNSFELQAAGCPIAFFKCDKEKHRAVVNLKFPFPVGRYILLKMISPSSESQNNETAPNIDIEYFAVFGSEITLSNSSNENITTNTNQNNHMK